MRYTTIIDISEMQALYKSTSVRLVYLHLVLKSGWHDNDRDIATVSLRTLAADTGLTLSAVRHALQQLKKAHMVATSGGQLRVRKWLSEQQVTPRKQSEKQAKAAQQREAELRDKEQREEAAAREREQREAARRQGKTQFMLYYEQKQAEAAAGDESARRIVESKKAMYEQHAAAMRAEQLKAENK